MGAAASSAGRRAAGPAFLAIWLLTALGIAARWAPALDAALVIAVPFALAAFVVATPTQRLVIGAILGFAIALAAGFGDPGALHKGAISGLFAASFLGTLQMLKVAVEASPHLAEQQAQVRALDDRRLHDTALLRANLLASVLAAGAIAVVAPLVSDTTDPDRRRLFAQGTLLGVALGILWSPFYVAMAICTRLVPGPSLASVVASGFALALAGLAISLVVHGNGGRGQPPGSLARTAVEAAALCALIVLANRFLGLGNLEAVILVIPPIAIAVAQAALRADPMPVARRWVTSLEGICVEALLVIVSLTLAQVIGDLIAGGVIAPPAPLAQAPVFALVAVAPVVMLSLALVGLHPIVSGSAMLPLLTSLGRLDDLVTIGSVLLGWMLCVALSVFVVPAMFAAALFRIPAREIVRGRNLAFCAGFSALGVTWLTGLQAWLA